ncbi:PilZ domain-containing protein [Baekduia alba]|uniref:PilZ domain-containing protein n=1 Tax=Baekduia alba TaxID=2997333 RepID=UPI00234053CA|nr:PilZ domain-containing protein [Baekduia alba]
MENRRADPRVPVVLDVHLGRKVGNEVLAHTRDLSSHGAQVVSDRPLRVDEQLTFDVELPSTHAHLRVLARVLRHQQDKTYALRFEQLDAAAHTVIDDLLRAIAAAPAR